MYSLLLDLMSHITYIVLIILLYHLVTLLTRRSTSREAFHQETRDGNVTSIAKAENVNIVQYKSTESESEDDFVNDLDSLSKILQKHARQTVGEMPMPGDIEAVSPVNQRLDHMDTYSGQKKISQLQSKVGLVEIFQLAKSVAENVASCNNYNDSAKANFVEKNKNNVLLVGQPGIGKTTLSKRFLSYVAVERVVLTEVKYPFYIRLGKVDSDENCTVLDFIFKYGLPSECTISKELKKEFAKDISSGCKVLLVLDGIDELNGAIPSKLVTCKLTEKVPVMRILQNVMSGDVLAQCYKLWTSRTRKAFEITPKIRPKTSIRVLGLDDQNKEALCRLVCKEKWEEVLKYLKKHPKLYSACYVPIICIIACISIVDSLERSVKIDEDTSIAAVMLDIFNQYSRTEHTRNDKPKDSLAALGKLAHYGIKEGTQVFIKSDFKELKIDDRVIENYTQSTLARGTNFRFKILEGDKQINFFHQMIQEFFAALHIVLRFEQFEFENTFLATAFESKWEEVALFVFGLQNEETWKKHQGLLGKKGAKQNRNRSAIKKLLRENGGRFSREGWSHQDKLKFLQIISWIDEAHSPEMTAEVVKNFPPSVFLQDIQMTPTSMSNLSFFIRSMGQKKPLRLLLNHCALDIESIKILQNAINGVQVDELDLSENKIGDAGLEELLPCLPYVSKKLTLVCCDITRQGIRQLAQFMDQENVKLDELNIRRNDIGKSGEDLLRISMRIKNKMHLSLAKITSSEERLLRDGTRDRHEGFLECVRI